jgi:hypothetical protein
MAGTRQIWIGRWNMFGIKSQPRYVHVCEGQGSRRFDGSIELMRDDLGRDRQENSIDECHRSENG